jgi:hypothetical protein
VVSHLLPPGPSGYQIILDELLRDLPPEELVLAGVGANPWGARRRLALPIFRYPSHWVERVAGDLVLLGGRALARVPGILPPVRRIFATLDPLLGFAARWAKSVGAELWVYAIDLHAEGFWSTHRLDPLMKRWVRGALQEAKRCFALSEVMAEWMRQTGARAPVEVLPPLVTVNPAPPPVGGKKILLFLGWVYTSNVRPLQWIEETTRGMPDIELCLGTQGSVEALRRIGLDPARWTISSLEAHEVRAAVARAHWTIAALDPEYSSREVLRVAWPTKLRDYLGTGRPVLVVSDPDYALGRIAEDQRWALRARDAGGLRVAIEALRVESQVDYAERCAAAARFADERMNNATVGAAFRMAALR